MTAVGPGATPDSDPTGASPTDRKNRHDQDGAAGPPAAVLPRDVAAELAAPLPAAPLPGAPLPGAPLPGAPLPGEDRAGWGGVRGWVAGFLLAQRSVHTRRGYAADLGAWLRWCAAHDLSPAAARRGHVDAYTRELETLPQPTTGRPVARATVARRLAALAGFYAYGLDQHATQLGLVTSPLERVARPRVGEDPTSLGLTRPALQALLAAAETHSARAHALVALLVHTGLRVDEALSRDVTDWRSEAGHEVLEVRRKGDVLGVTVLSPPVQGALRRYLAGRTDGPLFATGTGRRLDQPAAWRLVRALARAAGLPDAERVNPHALRHSFVTVALDAGVSLRDVQDAAGHADPATTRGYDRARHHLDRHATYAVAAHLAADPELPPAAVAG